MPEKIPQVEVEKAYEKVKADAEQGGYRLNPDLEFTKSLIGALLINEGRYGYWACPCRLASGKREEDLDIICPCDYRDPDLNQYGACYCALYVSEEIYRGKRQAESIPERRPPKEQRKIKMTVTQGQGVLALSHPVWRCSVCGYLCARDEPPEICPICKVKKERFQRFV